MDDAAATEPPQPRAGREALERPGPAVAPPAHARAEIADPDRLLGPPQLRWLSARLEAALAHLGTPGEVRLRLVADAEMSRANRDYAGHAGTTDVLTFDLSPPADSGGRLDADLLLCVDEARRQADRRAHPLERELLLYALHGVLHCLGHDDHDEAAAARMHRCEDDILIAIGVGPTYA
ncbi:MAG TPA: rRNA maturation RNase YbeY [Phycisphaerales bacterium]|nr:rRNA maturation RNase YbeY [Phycisphaerales bacterium]